MPSTNHSNTCDLTLKGIAPPENTLYGDYSARSDSTHDKAGLPAGKPHLVTQARWGVYVLGTTITTNSIANYAEYMPGKCSKRLENRRETSKPRCSHRKYKPNQQVAGIEPAQSATEFVVIWGAA